ncbi:hypothetical protein QT970_06470 [Microcoleus sp. herbarium8]|uniref:hypothetical protein n=1 Tax=Microcoleus sp. herbarium8 TaxID=3055436 RepID=UPI002FCEB1EB
MAKQVMAIDFTEEINLIRTMAQSANLGLLVPCHKQPLGWVVELGLLIAGAVR